MTLNSNLGYHGALLWIDLANRAWLLDRRPEEFFRQYPGGGLLATRLLLERTPPGIDPLGPENLLIFASSVLAGHPAAGLARFTVAGKSPLTGGIGETRVEGPWGTALKASGADAIIFTGLSAEPVAVLIEDGKVDFADGRGLWGLNVGQTTDRLEEQFGARIHVAVVGPAGENRVRFASIVTDRTYQASRMGLGAVMGAKRLKAIILRGGHLPTVSDSHQLESTTQSFERRITGNDLSRWQKDPPGFSCWLYLHGMDAALCVNNYSRSTIEGTERFKADEFLKRFRGAGNCAGCPNDCIKFLHPLSGNGLDPRASGIHQEITGTMGPNVGVTDLDWVLRANNLTNQYGVDPTSLGFTISFAMELFDKGILDPSLGQCARFGDVDSAERLMMDIIHRKNLGDVLAEGTRLAAKQIGGGAERFAMHVKGLEMVCFEPRTQTNLALGFATAPVGPRYDICEHDWDFDTQVGWEHSLKLSRTLGITNRIPMGYPGPPKVSNYKALNNLWSAADALDFCIFAIAPTRILSLPEMALMLAAVTGWETSDYEVMRIGERRNHLLRWYNTREGMSAKDNMLPDRFFQEPITSGPRQGDVLDRLGFEGQQHTWLTTLALVAVSVLIHIVSCRAETNRSISVEHQANVSCVLNILPNVVVSDLCQRIDYRIFPLNGLLGYADEYSYIPLTATTKHQFSSGVRRQDFLARFYAFSENLRRPLDLSPFFWRYGRWEGRNGKGSSASPKAIILRDRIDSMSLNHERFMNYHLECGSFPCIGYYRGKITNADALVVQYAVITSDGGYAYPRCPIFGRQANVGIDGISSGLSQSAEFHVPQLPIV